VIGIIGGTFDPIHFGHLRPALEVAELLNLDELRFIPNANPPHRWQPEADAQHRLEMVKLAIKNTPVFKLDDREYQRNGPSYTIDTLKEIRAEIGLDRPLCLLIGQDALQGFTQWRDWQGILNLTHLVVSRRPGYELDFTDNQWMHDILVNNADELKQAPNGMLFFAKVTQLAISATAIRNWLKQGSSVQYLTPAVVNNYLLTHKLYTR